MNIIEEAQDPAERGRRARKWNYLMKQDEFYKPTVWPQWAQKAVLARHLNGKDRFGLFFFLAANGLEPQVAADWVYMTDVETKGGRTKFYDLGYDDGAMRQKIQMVRDARSGRMFKGNKSYLDLETLGDNTIRKKIKVA